MNVSRREQRFARRICVPFIFAFAAVFSLTGCVEGADVTQKDTASVRVPTIGSHTAHLAGGEYINSIAWSPDSHYLAASDRIGHQLYIWDSDTGALVAKTPNSAAVNTGLAFTRDGQFVLNAVSDASGLAAFGAFDSHTGTHKRDVSVTDPSVRILARFSAKAILPSSDGKHVVVLHANGLSYGVYDIGLWQPTAIVPLNIRSPVLSAVLSPDGKRLAIGCYNGEVQLWDIAEGKKIEAFHAGPENATTTLFGSESHIDTVGFSPDGKYLATGAEVNRNTYGEQLRLWDSGTLALVRSFNTGVNVDVTSLSFSPNGKLIATIAEGDGPRPLRIWDVTAASELKEITTHTITTVVAFSPDGKKLAYGGEGGVYVLDISYAQ